MKDKELQKDLWRKDESIKILDDILGAIRASEANTEQQSDLISQAGQFGQTMKCFNCNKVGHHSANCPNHN